MRLKTVGVVLAALIALLGGVVMIASGVATERLRALDDTWHAYVGDRSEKARLESALRAAIGFGGMIHYFKDYVLRQDPDLIDAFRFKVGAARAVLDQYRALPLNTAEEVALDDISATVDRYDRNIGVVRRMGADGATALAIDKVVKIDDDPALRGLATLRSVARAGAGERPTKARLIADIRARLGFGGMIHNLKNLVLRGEMQRAGAITDEIDRTKVVVEHYRGLGANDAEALVLDDLVDVLEAYRAAVDEITAKIDGGAMPREIDKAIAVDAARALRALRVLERESVTQLEARYGLVEAALAEMIAVAQGTQVVVVALSGATVVVILWLLVVHVVGPIRRTTAVMSRLAENDLEVSVPDVHADNEIGAMTRALAVFKENAIGRREVESRLAEANEALERQLEEITEVRERAEQQAGRAIALAESIAVAREDAEKSRADAEEQRRRVQVVLDTVNDAIITIDDRGRIETFSRGAEDTFGYRTAEVRGRNVSVLMPEPHRSAHDEYIRRYLETHEGQVIGQGRELTGTRKDGSEFPIELAVTVMELGGETKFTGIVRDITERKEAEAEIRRLAMNDPLTGVANRNQFNIRLEEAIRLGKRMKTGAGLMLFDLDKFKTINDTHGHPMGDALLKHVAEVIISQCRDVDIVARLGGDEFAVILNSVDRKADEHIPAERIIKLLAEPVELEGTVIHTGTSIGIAFWPDDAETPEDLYRNADLALYQAKRAGRGTYRFYAPEMG